jgi:hypothetical protein
MRQHINTQIDGFWVLMRLWAGTDMAGSGDLFQLKGKFSNAVIGRVGAP